MESIICPCCGGQSANYLNCDYCGSYLVRFIKRNLSYDEASLGNDTRIILGIQEELQANLDEQINTRTQNHICSKTHGYGFTIEVKNPRAIGDAEKYTISGENCYVNPSNPFDVNDVSLILVVRSLEFKMLLGDPFGERSDARQRQLEEKQKIDWLKRVGLYELCAKCDDEIISMSDMHGVCHSFYLNFGKDVAGATKALSSFVYGIAGPNDTSSLKFSRISESDVEYRSKQQDFKEDRKDDRVKFYLYVLYGFLIANLPIAYLLCRMFRDLYYWMIYCVALVVSICTIIWKEISIRKIGRG